MSLLFKIILHNKLLGRFFNLIFISVLSIVTTIFSGYMLSSFFDGSYQSKALSLTTFMIITLSAYILSSVLGLAAEFQSQTLSAKIAGVVGSKYIKHVSDNRSENMDVHDLSQKYSSSLTTQLERFRAEYVFPFVSCISRGVVLGVASLFFFYAYKWVAVAFAIGGLIVGIAFYGIMLIFVNKVDRGLSSALKEMGSIVQKVIGSFSYLFYSAFQTPLSQRFNHSYDKYGRFRGYNGVVSLLPRSLIEAGLIVGALFISQEQLGLLQMQDTVFMGFLLLRLNPQLQIFLKNVSTLNMSLSSLDLLALHQDPNAKSRDISVFQNEHLIWDYQKNPILQLMGPSGSGKTTLAHSIARHYRAAGCTVGFIEANPTLPVTNLEEILAMYPEFASLQRSVGISTDLKLDVNKLSNGERQRVLIAISLLQKTDVLIIDEGLSALGADHIRLVFQTILSQRIPLVFVSHHIQADHYVEKNNVQVFELKPQHQSFQSFERVQHVFA